MLPFPIPLKVIVSMVTVIIFRPELVYLEVNNKYVNKTITNVIGQIYGSIELDKLALL